MRERYHRAGGGEAASASPLGGFNGVRDAMRKGMVRVHCGLVSRVRTLLSDESGQGTTEYAILVGVIVVIAIVAVTAFKGKIQELWTAITDGINSL